MTFEIIFIWLPCAAHKSEGDVIGEDRVGIVYGSEVLVWDKIGILVIVYFIRVLGDNGNLLLSYSPEV